MRIYARPFRRRGFGLFVKLDELLIDGLVHISTLKNDYYHFDADRQRLVGSSGIIYRLGDKVKVQVINVNLDEKKIDFALLDNFRKGMNLGKTAKQKAKKTEKPVFKEVKTFKKEKPRKEKTKKKKQAVKSKNKVTKKTKKK